MSVSPVEVCEDPVPFEEAILAVKAAKTKWLRYSIADRMRLLEAVRVRTAQVAATWVSLATEAKQIPPDSPLVGEEWISGPYALLGACNGLLNTLAQMEERKFLRHLPQRNLKDGQLAVEVIPHSVWDHLLLSGISVEVWMQAGVTADNLANHTASIYDQPSEEMEARVALVLGAGNIASIAPLDCLFKLFAEWQVVVLKLNPVNEYLFDVLNQALQPLIAEDLLRIVKGDGALGAELTVHPDIDEIHITGAGSTHDAIVWGAGAEGDQNKRAGTPKNSRRVTSELGAVCPTIVVPGPWSDADLKFQAENVATQKLHNSGFNCVAMQALLVPGDWSLNDRFLAAVESAINNVPPRGLYYPGADGRLDDFTKGQVSVREISRAEGPACRVVLDPTPELLETEVFAPAFSLHPLEGKAPERFLEDAITFANTKLHGTLGANIIIHPKTIDQIGKERFDELLQSLRYGTIAVNAWTGVGFLSAPATWGAFPGHTLNDVQSGIGVVHNSFLFDKPERTVIKAPFRPFPRGVFSGQLSLLPKPPWFVTNRRGKQLGRLLTEFQSAPSLWKIPGIFLNALRG